MINSRHASMKKWIEDQAAAEIQKMESLEQELTKVTVPAAKKAIENELYQVSEKAEKLCNVVIFDHISTEMH